MKKIALLSTTVCPHSEKLIEIFQDNDWEISAVIIEKSIRKNFSASELKFRQAHDKMNKQFKKYGFFRRTAKSLWDLLIPNRFQNYLFIHITKIPVLKKFSLERFAIKKGIPVYSVQKHSSQVSVDILEKLDLNLIVYGSSHWLLKKPLIDNERRRIVTVHPGKLPEYKGLDALPWSIMNGDELGSTAFCIDESIDGGDIISFDSEMLQKGDSIPIIKKRMSNKAPSLIFNAVKSLEDGSVQAQKQKDKGQLCKPMSFDELMTAESVLQKRIESDVKK